MGSRALFDQRQLNRIRVEAQALASNEVLSDADTDTVRELLAEKMDELHSLDADISRLQEVLGSLVARRWKISSWIERLRTAIAPHRKMPQEILEKVFRYCESLPVRLPHRYPPRDIWAILQVCSRWRKVALADPHLWSTLDVHISRFVNKSRAQTLEIFIHDVLSNRGGQGVVEYQTYIADSDEWERTLNFTRMFSSRLRKLNIVFHPCFETDSLPIVASYIDHRLPQISSISFPSTSSSHESWVHLTHLTVEAFTISMFCRVLRHCIQLVNCKITFMESRVAQEICQDPIILQHLDSVLIKQNNGITVNEFLNVLVLPALKSLQFGYSTGWRRESVMNLIKRSGCSLERFESGYKGILVDDILPLMRAMQDLTTFEASTRSPISEWALHIIRVEGLCPKLRTLKGLEITSVRVFVELLQDRWDNSNEVMRDVDVRVRKRLLAPDMEYYEGLLHQLKENTQSFKINIF